MQDYATYKQQSGGTYAEGSSTAVGLGIRLLGIQVDPKATGTQKPDGYPLGSN